MRGRVHLQFKGFALAADLDLPARGVCALFGPSGSGKTSLLRWLAGLERGSDAHLEVNGEVWQDDSTRIFLPAHRRPVGYVTQDTTLFPHLDVRGNLMFGLRRVTPARRRIGLEQAVELLGLGHLLARRTEGLSGGERQRIGIARALLTSPDLLLLDEPLSALDTARKREILPYLERLHAELAIPVILVSHAPDEVARLADYLVVLESGQVRAAGPLAAVLAQLDLPIQLGDDAGVVLEGTVALRDREWHLAAVDSPAGRLWVRDGGVPEGAPARLRILARDVSIALDDQRGSITNTLPARISRIAADDHPALCMISLTVGESTLLARLTRRSAQRLGLAPGLLVLAQVKAVAVL